MLRITGIGLIVLFIVIQFFRPERNSKRVNPAEDMLLVSAPPEQVSMLLKTACYDCHSNQTHYPWYGRLQPLSWYLKSHITRGKKELNYSEFGSLDKSDRIGILVNICEVMEDGSMPLQSYLLLHKQARLTQEERDDICIWTEEEALRVMRE